MIRCIVCLISILVAQECSAQLLSASLSSRKTSLELNNRAETRGVVRIRNSQIYGDIIVRNYSWADQRRFRRSFNSRLPLSIPLARWRW